jgi:hypothetical protein
MLWSIQVRRFLQRYFKIMQDHYPERLGKMSVPI